MPEWAFDQASTKQRLRDFFSRNRADIAAFGSTVNQTFEAFVFASVIEWYRSRGWIVHIVNPIDQITKKTRFRLKFSTRGRPDNYSYAVAHKRRKAVQIRHQLRVATNSHRRNKRFYANVCLDVAVIRACDLSGYKTFFAVPNRSLITFGEAKHMSAFAELIAGFLGLVHELQPKRLQKLPSRPRSGRHLAPFLFVSGLLLRTAQGIEYTIKRRGFDVDIYSSTNQLSSAFAKK